MKIKKRKNKGIYLSALLNKWGDKLISISDKMTPKFREVKMKEIPEERIGVKLSPKRRNYKLIDMDSLSRESKLLSKNPKLRRDLMWAYNNRELAKPLIGYSGEFNRIKEGRDRFNPNKTEYYATLSNFERPYLNTVKVEVIYKSSDVLKYLVSEYEDELIQSKLDGLEGKLFLLKENK